MMSLVLAIVLPWLLGVVWLRKGGVSQWSLLLAYGYLLGILFTTLLLRALDSLGLTLSFPLCALLLSVLIFFGIQQTRTLWQWNGSGSLAAWRHQPFWHHLLFGLVLVGIAVKFYGFAVEIGARPLYPWDAWTTWGVRPQVWFEFKQLVPFVDAASWLATDHSLTTAYLLEAWHYPPAVSLIQLWMSLGYGQWHESMANLPWLLCGVALGLGFYGQARLWTGKPLLSLVFTYLLLSIPLLNAHVALAGYADLWMATIYSLAAIALLQWLRTRDRAQGLLALLLGLTCALVKVEGVVWLLTLLPVASAALTPRRYRFGLLLLLVVLLMLWFWNGGFSATLPGLGTIYLQPERIEIPYLGRFDVAYSPNWEPFLDNFFVLGSWHLFWYVLILLVVVAMPKIATDRLLLIFSAVVSSGLAMLFFLFLMTEAREWAAKYTSINRLFLHITPLLMFYGLILFQALRAQSPNTNPLSEPQSA
ncbi:MAG: hypothetical protein V2J55_14920 [Candidatus Competibacteraceae bacterium]|jgi:hypothetical protein|nr:hypothetical protein [Candidatus Competibacteraceae bacterium]